MLWKEKYKLGVKTIDDQHRELFDRVGAFVETVRKPVEWSEKVDAVNETLAFMKDYVVSHFRDEEAYQREVGYPGRAGHARIHQEMVAYVAAVSEEFENNGYSQALMQHFSGRLLAWLINHVASEDQKIADFVASKEDKS